MGVRINTNLPALEAGRQAGRANTLLAKSLEKLASAARINRAGDDASGLAIAERFSAQIRQGRTEINNLQSGVSAAQTADGGLEAQQQATQRLRELAIQASNGTLTDDQRAALNTEAQQLIQQLDDVAEGTQFNEQNLLKQNTSIDPGTEGTVQLNINSSTAASLGADTVDLSTVEGAAQAVETLDTALSRISQNRSNVGAQINRFSSAIEQREGSILHAEDSRSRIRDLDVAQESILQAQAQIKKQSSLATLLQANVNAQSVLRLF
ncbi:MAG: flagellin FliC [Candidatus Hydrogenedentes bacterium]|nr:flagellin FliC [Candidatus Hydrogenedentota bacterium]